MNKFNQLLRNKLLKSEEKINKLENEKSQLKNEKKEGKLDLLQIDVLSQINKSKLKILEETVENYVLLDIKKENEIKKLKDELSKQTSKMDLTRSTEEDSNKSLFKPKNKSSKNIIRINSCFNLKGNSLPEIPANNPKKVERIKNIGTINNGSSVLCLASFTADDKTYYKSYIILIKTMSS